MRNKKHYTPAQSAKLNQLRQLHADKVIFNANIEAQIRAQIEEKSRDFELRESRLMNEAKALGVPKTEIGRAVGLANWGLLEAKYAQTADEFVALSEGVQYEIDKEASTVTVNFWIASDEVRYDGPEVVPINFGGYPMTTQDGAITKQLHVSEQIKLDADIREQWNNVN